MQGSNRKYVIEDTLDIPLWPFLRPWSLACLRIAIGNDPGASLPVYFCVWSMLMGAGDQGMSQIKHTTTRMYTYLHSLNWLQWACDERYEVPATLSL